MQKHILHFLFSSLLLIGSYPGRAQIITTYAGNGILGHTRDGGSATSAEVGYTASVAVDRLGNVYFSAANSCIRMVNTAGIITTIAGNDSLGCSGDGGAATAARLIAGAIAVDDSGNLYIADHLDNVVRKVNTLGIITTCAGIPFNSGYSGDRGPATNAMLNAPEAIAVDGRGNLYIADFYDNAVRKVSNGIITTLAGNGTEGYSGNGGPATSATLSKPTAIAVDNIGNVYIADFDGFTIRKVDTSGIITFIAGAGAGYTGDGGPATAAGFKVIGGLAVDSRGYIFVSDNGNNVIRVINPSGIISTYVGNGTAGYIGDNGPAYLSELNYPWGVAVDATSSLFIGDFNNYRVRKVSTPTATPQLNKASTNVSIYPNPAQKDLTIASAEKITSFTITNILGQTVYFAIDCNSKEMTIDISPFLAGAYFIMLNGSEMRKFVKQ